MNKQENWFPNWFKSLQTGSCNAIAGNKVDNEQLWELIDWLYAIQPNDEIFRSSDTNKKAFAVSINISIRHLIERSLLVGQRLAYINMLDEILQPWNKYLE